MVRLRITHSGLWIAADPLLFGLDRKRNKRKEVTAEIVQSLILVALVEAKNVLRQLIDGCFHLIVVFIGSLDFLDIGHDGRMVFSEALSDALIGHVQNASC